MRAIWVLGVLIASGVLLSSGDSLSQERSSPPTKEPANKLAKPNTKLAQIMHQKLEDSQRVLEGIALGDFAKITKNAKDLLELSKTAEWRAFPSPQYLGYSGDFQRAAEKLLKSAQEKNLDAATLNYVELTLSCAHCHKYIREVRSARIGGGSQPVALARALVGS